MPRQKAIAIDRDEATPIPRGDTSFWLLLSETDASLIAQEILPASLVARCQRLLDYHADCRKDDES